MAVLFVKNAHLRVTIDADRREISDGALVVQDKAVAAVGSTAEVQAWLDANGLTPDETLNAQGHIVMPGLINTHHHMFQSLLRAVPASQNQGLLPWIDGISPFWPKITPDMIYASALTAMAELMLSGCTTTSDHCYIAPNGSRIDDEIRAAQEIGMRFHPGRGSISIKGGNHLDPMVETEAHIERDCIRLIDTYHESERYGMVRIVVAPGSPFSVPHDFMREQARLARSYGDRDVRLHTHFVETLDDITLLRSQLNLSPEEYLQEYEWVGDDVWHAHCVHLSDDGIHLFAHTQTSVCHCPHSNMRLGVGIAPIPKMRKHGVRVGLGVDGSASNDGGHILSEARAALMLARAGTANPAAMTAREALEIGTLGSAAVLGRDDVGALAPGMAADFIVINLNRLGYAGGYQHDALATVMLCTPVNVDYSVINGRFVVREGQLVNVELGRVIEQHNRYTDQLVKG
ncbi:MAG: 8-oxoguanine deaminase [Anaerolineae bacterium]|nr:8-oxoguanine deaminase [Anaerolineae bacterium]